MFLLHPTPVVQSFCPSKPSKHPHFVVPRLLGTSFVSSSDHAQLFWHCRAVARHCKVIESSSAHHAHGQKASRRVWTKESKINFEQQHHGRQLIGVCTGVIKKGLKARVDEGFGGGDIKCYVPSKDVQGLMKGQQSSSSDGDLPHSAAVSNMEGKTLWSKFTQSVNLSGTFFSAKVMVKDRHLAIPHVSVPDISWIDWKVLRERGFKGVLFDKDNTLTAPYGQNIWPPLQDSLEECREVFGGRIAFLSNSAGLYQYDPLGLEANVIENRLGIPVIRHGQKKPGGNALAVSDYFSCDPSMLIMVGDRYFTDVVYGNNNGLLTIRSAPLTTLGEPFVVKRVRSLEETLVDWWRRRGALPPKHKFFDNPVDFIKDPGCW